jgi:hypothetical protein
VPQSASSGCQWVTLPARISLPETNFQSWSYDQVQWLFASGASGCHHLPASGCKWVKVPATLLLRVLADRPPWNSVSILSYWVSILSYDLVTLFSVAICQWSIRLPQFTVGQPQAASESQWLCLRGSHTESWLTGPDRPTWNSVSSIWPSPMAICQWSIRISFNPILWISLSNDSTWHVTCQPEDSDSDDSTVTVSIQGLHSVSLGHGQCLCCADSRLLFFYLLGFKFRQHLQAQL